MTEILQFLTDRIRTPIGEMVIVADRDGNLRATDWTDYEKRMLRLLRLHYGDGGFQLEPARDPNGLSDAIRRYFAGELHAIDILPAQTGGTPFQRDVWRTLRTIPCGTTMSSYAQLAKTMGRPHSSSRCRNG